MDEPTPAPTLAHLTLLLDQLDASLAYQRDEWDGLDRKGTTVLATTGVVLGLLVSNAAMFQGYPEPAPGLYLAAVAVLVAGLGAAILTFWPRGFIVVPEPAGLVGYVGQTSEFTVHTLLLTKAEAYRRNRGPLPLKLWALRAQLGLLALAGLMLVAMLWIGR